MTRNAHGRNERGLVAFMHQRLLGREIESSGRGVRGRKGVGRGSDFA